VDFSIPEELAQLREAYRSFLDREVAPVEERWRPQLQRGEWTDGMSGDAASLRRRSAEEGFYGCYLPEDVGGQSVSTLGTALLVEDTGASGLTFADGLVGPPNPGAPSPVLLEASSAVRERYLPSLVSGETTMCFALTEPEAGSDAQAITTRAERDGDGWVLNGTKHYITGADDASLALLFAVTEPGKRAHGGITAFVVPRERYRVTKQQLTVADGHPYELVLEDARVPDDHVVGEVGYGFYTAMQFLNAGRAYIGAQCVGLARFCLEVAVAHAQERTAFGEPLARKQGVTFPLADTAVEIEAARLLTYRLAWKVDRGEAPMLDSSMVKLYGSELAFNAADRAMQVLGGQGLMREAPIERVWRTARMLRIVEGASEVQRMVIGRSLGL
jgi:alkylation response protein AidB-like acyl-CoA dehydrogenase